MRYLKIITILALIILMALPSFADRRRVKKGIGPMLSSARIALFSDPPRYDEAMAYFDTVLIDYGPIPEAYFYRGNIFAEYASREYNPQGKIEYFNKMATSYDSMQIACENKDVKKNYKDKCDEFKGIIDSIRVFYWSENYNKAVRIIERIDNELKPAVANAADSAEKAAAREAMMAVADTGIAHFRLAAIVDPSKYRTMEGMGLLYDRVGMTDSAMVWFKKAYDLAPNEINLVQSLAYSHIQKKDWNNSIIYFRKILELVPDDVNTILNMAVCFNNTQQFDSVYAYNLKAIAIDSTISSAWFDIGQLWLWRSQNYSDSARSNRTAENNTAADKYDKMKNNALDSAAHYYCHATEIDPSDELAHEQCAVVSMILGRYELAADKFKVLTVSSPQVFDFWINLGDCLIQLQKFAEAIEPYEKALELSPDDCKLWEVLLSLYESETMTEKVKAAQAKMNKLGCK